MLLDVIYLLCALAILVLAGQWAVKSLTKISAYLGISAFFVAFIVMALATSLPELFIGISAGIFNEPSLAFGAILGANIISITLITGIGILVAKKTNVKSGEVLQDSRIMLLLAIAPLILFMIGGGISRVDGVILILLYLLYLGFLLRNKHEERHEHITRKELYAGSLLFILSLVLLFFSARFAVRLGVSLSEFLGITPFLVGVVLFAIGTSLPQLGFIVQSSLNHKGEFSVGTIIGAVTANSTLVLGTTALIAPITISLFPFVAAAGFLLLSLIVFQLFLERQALEVREGVTLLLIYIAFMSIQLYLPSL